MKTLLLMFALMATACALAKAADERPISEDAAYLADLDKRGEAIHRRAQRTARDRSGGDGDFWGDLRPGASRRTIKG